MRTTLVVFLLVLAAQCILATAENDKKETRCLLRGRAKAHAAIMRSIDRRDHYTGRMGMAVNPKVHTTLETRQNTEGLGSTNFKASKHVVGLESARRGDVRGIHPMLYFQQHAVSSAFDQ